MRSGRAYRQRIWEPATNAIAGGWLPTPTTTTSKQGVGSYNGKGRPLLAAAVNLPTPNASDALRGRDVARSRPDDKARELATVLRDQMLPTPTTNDSKNTTLPPSQIERDGLAGAMLRDPSIPTGGAMCLNPSFLEEMMGFPIGWTASTP